MLAHRMVVGLGQRVWIAHNLSPIVGNIVWHAVIGLTILTALVATCSKVLRAPSNADGDHVIDLCNSGSLPRCALSVLPLGKRADGSAKGHVPVFRIDRLRSRCPASFPRYVSRETFVMRDPRRAWRGVAQPPCARAFSKSAPFQLPLPRTSVSRARAARSSRARRSDLPLRIRDGHSENCSMACCPWRAPKVVGEE